MTKTETERVRESESEGGTLRGRESQSFRETVSETERKDRGREGGREAVRW